MTQLRPVLIALAALLAAALPAGASVVPVHQVAAKTPAIRVVAQPVRYITRRVTVRVPYTVQVVKYRTTKRYQRGGVVTTITRRVPVVTFKRAYRTQVRYLRVAVLR